ncbi:MAG TPA: porphobilinogen synthase [Luteolibacter sp.]|nr:porphobilinogen synthase [Luteolibacter sp.]
MIRPRRNRRTAALRSMVRETTLSPADFILPVFLHEDAADTPIDSMPGVTRWSLDSLVSEAGEALTLGIPAVVLFPKIEENLKSPHGEECFNDDGLVPRAIRALKSAHPELCVITDVALDPYNSDGHDGIVHRDARGNLVILNDETVEILCRQALSHARAGADIVAPSDMMDGRVGAIRAALDAEGFTDVSILSYTAKYASAFYGPFRGALDSAPKDGDKKTYQMDPGNIREALRETLLDEDEGADMLMVKPAGPYLDVIAKVRETSTLPVAAYQVSGEYLMLKSAAAAGWLDEKAAVLESLTAIKRAGASMILTYFATRAARWLREDG